MINKNKENVFVINNTMTEIHKLKLRLNKKYSLDIQKKDYDYPEEYTYEKNICSLCNSDTNRIFDTFINNKNKFKIKTCYFCNIIMNFHQNDTLKIILVSSNLSQKEINMQYNMYYNKNEDICLPDVVDENVKKLNINIFDFVNTESIYKNKNYKIFFTCKVLDDLVISNVFKKLKKDSKHEFEKYFNIPFHKFSDNEINDIMNTTEHENNKNK